MIEINNLTNFAIDKKNFSTVAKKVLKGENRVKEIISLAFVSKEEIKKLNRKFRGKNKATDVLSFELGDPPLSRLGGTTARQGKNYLGEIVICPEMVENNIEMIRVFIHGILHLCGYDHEKSEKKAKAMHQKEEEYFSKIF